MLRLLAPDEFRAIADVLARATYSAEGLAECLGPVSVPTHPGTAINHLLHLTRRGRPLDILIRLFLLGAPVDIDAAAAAFDPVPIETWIRAGLLETRNNSALGRVRLMAFQRAVLAVDQPLIPEIDALPDQVMGLTASTMSLANIAIRRPARTVLDLGTGSGIQAILASRYSEQVCGVDRSPRALEFARFNAGLNSCAHLELLEGNAFEPVQGRKFDLILSNPPFAISPSLRYIYRDSGMPGDLFCRSLITKAPEFLNEGGYCQMLLDLVQISGQDWKERVSAWFQGTGCDAWIMRSNTIDAASYVNMWIRDTEHDSPELTARRYEEWTSYFEREKIEAIHSGVLMMRRAGGRANWVRIEDAPDVMSNRAGEDILLGFDLHDYLDQATDENLLEEKLNLSPHICIDQHCEWSDGTWRITMARVHLTSGLQYAGNIDRNGSALISLFDGKRTLREVISGVASNFSVTPDRIGSQCIALVRKLVERGYLLPASVRFPEFPSRTGVQ